MTEQDGSGSGQGILVKYVVTDRRCISSPRNLTEEEDLVVDRRDDGERN